MDRPLLSKLGDDHTAVQETSTIRPRLARLETGDVPDGVDLMDQNSTGAKWLRRQAYMQKYGVGSTTVAKWDNAGRIRTMRIGNVKYVEDRLPEPDSTNQSAA
jgi:hypothetical protein